MKAQASHASIKSLMKNMRTLLYGAGFAKFLAFASIPIVTRIYTPEELGVLALFTAGVVFIVPFLSCRYPSAIPTLKSHSTALNLSVLSLAITFFGLVSLSVLMNAAARVESESRFVSSVLTFPGLFLASCGLAAILEVTTNWAVRQRRFSKISADHIVQSIADVTIRIAAGIAGWRPEGLLVAYAAGHGGCAFLTFREFFLELKSHRVSIRAFRLLAVLRIFSAIPKYRLPSQLILVLSTHLPIVFFGEIFDVGQSGQLALALMVVSAPVAILGTTASHAYLSEIRVIGRNNPSIIKKLTFDLLKRMFVLAIPPALILFLFGELIFGIIFGEEWAVAGRFSQILAPVLVSQFIATPIMHVLTLYNDQRHFLMINLGRLSIVFISIFLGWRLDMSAERFLMLYSFGLTAHYIMSSSSIMKSLTSKGLK